MCICILCVCIDQDAEEKTVAALQESLANTKIEERKIKLTIILSGRSEGQDAISFAVSKALTEQAIVGANIISVPDFLMLPYVAQQYTKSSDAIIVAAILTTEFANSPVYATSISSAIYNLGISSSTPIIPAILLVNSLLEAKATLPGLASDWITAITNQIDRRFESKPVVSVELKPKVVVKPGVGVDILMQNLRDTLKVKTHWEFK